MAIEGIAGKSLLNKYIILSRASTRASEPGTSLDVISFSITRPYKQNHVAISGWCVQEGVIYHQLNSDPSCEHL